MHPVLLQIGSFTIYSYGFMVALGFVAGIMLAYFLAKKLGLNSEKVLDVSIFVIIGSIIGARLFYGIFYWNELKSPLEIFMVWNGGLVFYGGLIFGIAGLLLACLIYKLSFLDFLDIAAPATAIGYAFGRLGCFFRGCCYGDICSLPWAVKFPEVLGLRHPTQIYASITGFLICLILVAVLNKRQFPGQIVSLGLIMYSLYRFLIEYIRVNPRVFANLTESQLFSIALFILGIILYGIFSRRKLIK